MTDFLKKIHEEDFLKSNQTNIIRKSYTPPELTIFSANEITHGNSNHGIDNFATGS